jgi:hypothetical protein
MNEAGRRRDDTTAGYISELTFELAQLAAAGGYSRLRDLLQTARLEADRLRKLEADHYAPPYGWQQ